MEYDPVVEMKAILPLAKKWMELEDIMPCERHYAKTQPNTSCFPWNMGGKLKNKALAPSRGCRLV